jgi:hypothetical protein
VSGTEEKGMSVNSFDDEDGMWAAYDAAERVLWHAIDAKTLQVPGKINSESTHKDVRDLARRIADAVIHSSAKDITEMNLGVAVERVERIISSAAFE